MQLKVGSSKTDDRHQSADSFIGVLRDQLLQTFASGYENPKRLQGVLAFKIYGQEAGGCWLEFRSDSYELLTSEPPFVDAEVSLSPETLRTIANNSMSIDWLDLDLVSQIDVEGRMELVEHFASCLLQPHPDTLYRYLDAQRLHFSRGFRMANAVERLKNPTMEAVLGKMKWSFPFIIERSTETEQLQNWSLEKLALYFGNAPVKARFGEEPETIQSFASRLKAVGELHSLHANMPRSGIPYSDGILLPEVMKPVFSPTFFKRDDFLEPRLWLGALNPLIPATRLHRDPYTGFLQQIMGEKRVDFYSADQSIYLSPMKAHNAFQPCWFQPERSDYERFPKAADAAKFSVTVKPGETLVIPQGWFHQTHIDEKPNMSVSYSWKY